MRCPRCESTSLAVLEKRDTEEGVRRRRQCQGCDHRFTTYERAEMPQLTVLKRDGQREQYSEEKVLSGMEAACKNRPIHPEQLQKAAGAITKELRLGTSEVVTSNQIGELVLDQLRFMDPIAYLRFVSVHRSFTDLETFKHEIKRLESLSNKDRHE